MRRPSPASIARLGVVRRALPRHPSVGRLLAAVARARARTNEAVDHVEAAIMALGWARQNLVSPPAAAQYVVAGMRCFAGFLVLSLAARAYWECV